MAPSLEEPTALEAPSKMAPKLVAPEPGMLTRNHLDYTHY